MIRFIRPSEVIKRLITTIDAILVECSDYLPDDFVSFSDRVFGSDKVVMLQEEYVQNATVPSAFVTLSDGSAITLTEEVVDQNIFHGIDISLVLETKDRRGQTAEEQSVFFKQIFLYALNGWRPVKDPEFTEASPLRYVSDAAVYADHTRYIRVFSFVHDSRFRSPPDGYDDSDTEFDVDVLELIKGEIRAFYGDGEDDYNTVEFEADNLYEDN